MVMILHRTNRDVNRCRRKYGEAWKRYEKEVPYLFIPVSISPAPFSPMTNSFFSPFCNVLTSPKYVI